MVGQVLVLWVVACSAMLVMWLVVSGQQKARPAHLFIVALNLLAALLAFVLM